MDYLTLLDFYSVCLEFGHIFLMENFVLTNLIEIIPEENLL